MDYMEAIISWKPIQVFLYLIVLAGFIVTAALIFLLNKKLLDDFFKGEDEKKEGIKPLHLIFFLFPTGLMIFMFWLFFLRK